MVIVHLRWEYIPKAAFHKLKLQKCGLCTVLKKINSNAYLIELPPEPQISPIFNVADLYPFDRFDGEVTPAAE